ncbi:hypothetical protein ElyMa_002353000 [Elysia marginata]|uniref:MAM domain-containing protein n=1 Tax=Elysia marginata TaxID=1093978 RepID=A0AAV4G8S0_9GAST|nr:hypothetical protein ElyMa_002353000 [Elysia marginata]
MRTCCFSTVDNSRLLVWCLVILAVASYTLSQTNTSVDSKCTKNRKGLPACNFNNRNCYNEGRVGKPAWTLVKIGENGPVTPYEKGYVHLDANVSNGKPRKMSAQIGPGRKAICVQFFYATAGSSKVPISFYISDGPVYVSVYKTEAQTGGTWRNDTFSCCLPNIGNVKRIAIEATATENGTAAIDYVDIRQSNMPCENGELVCYPRLPSLIPSEPVNAPSCPSDGDKIDPLLSCDFNAIIKSAPEYCGWNATSGWDLRQKRDGTGTYDVIYASGVGDAILLNILPDHVESLCMEVQFSTPDIDEDLKNVFSVNIIAHDNTSVLWSTAYNYNGSRNSIWKRNSFEEALPRASGRQIQVHANAAGLKIDYIHVRTSDVDPTTVLHGETTGHWNTGQTATPTRVSTEVTTVAEEMLTFETPTMPVESTETTSQVASTSENMVDPPLTAPTAKNPFKSTEATTPHKETTPKPFKSTEATTPPKETARQPLKSTEATTPHKETTRQPLKSTEATTPPKETTRQPLKSTEATSPDKETTPEYRPHGSLTWRNNRNSGALEHKTNRDVDTCVNRKATTPYKETTPKSFKSTEATTLYAGTTPKSFKSTEATTPYKETTRQPLKSTEAISPDKETTPESFELTEATTPHEKTTRPSFGSSEAILRDSFPATKGSSESALLESTEWKTSVVPRCNRSSKSSEPTRIEQLPGLGVSSSLRSTTEQVFVNRNTTKTQSQTEQLPKTIAKSTSAPLPERPPGEKEISTSLPNSSKESNTTSKKKLWGIVWGVTGGLLVLVAGVAIFIVKRMCVPKNYSPKVTPL